MKARMYIRKSIARRENLSSFQILTLSTYTVSCSSRRFLLSVAQGPVHDMRWVDQDR